MNIEIIALAWGGWLGGLGRRSYVSGWVAGFGGAASKPSSFISHAKAMPERPNACCCKKWRREWNMLEDPIVQSM
jgi:hypothetical protein